VQSVEFDLIRDKVVSPLTGLGTWVNLLPTRRAHEFKRFAKLAKGWKSTQKKRKKMDDAERAQAEQADTFLWTFMDQSLAFIETIPGFGDVDRDALEFAERFLELLIDVEVREAPAHRNIPSLPTRTPRAHARARSLSLYFVCMRGVGVRARPVPHAPRVQGGVQRAKRNKGASFQCVVAPSAHDGADKLKRR